MGWRDYAREVQSHGDNRANRDKSLPPEANLRDVSNVPEAVAQSRLREWHSGLSAIDELNSPPGWTLNQWLKTLDASYWLYENFASQAVRDGWSANDLFGVLLQKPGWGGLADRLGDNRGLIMDRDRARWRSFGVPETFGRGGGDGMMPLWTID